MARDGKNPDLRRAHLKDYVLACIHDGALTWQDVKSGEVFDRLLKVVAVDVRAVLTDVGKQGAGGLVQLGAAWLGQLGQKLTEGSGK